MADESCFFPSHRHGGAARRTEALSQLHAAGFMGAEEAEEPKSTPLLGWRPGGWLVVHCSAAK